MRVIGIGSPWGADQLGWRAVEILREEWQSGEGEHEWIILDRPGALLLQSIQDAEPTLLLDACVGPIPGRVIALLATDAASLSLPAVGSHAFGLSETLSLGCSLGMSMAHVELLLLSVEPSAGQGEWCVPSGFFEYVQHCKVRLQLPYRSVD